MASDALPDPSDHDGVARAEFPVVRRGFDPAMVRGYLRSLSLELKSSAKQITAAENRAASAEGAIRVAEDTAAAADRALAEAKAAPLELDEDRLTAIVGEETTRVLQTARQGAAERLRRAEEEAERLVAEATAKAEVLASAATAKAETLTREAAAAADAVRSSATTEAQKLREDAAAAAETLRSSAQSFVDAEVEAARETGREMIAEAKLVRERMLRDLARKRKDIRQQIEQLRAGRDRLLAAHDVVRESLDEVTRELEGSLPEARTAAEQAGRLAALEPEATVEQLEAEIEAARAAGLPIVASAPAEADVGSAEDTEDTEDPVAGVASEPEVPEAVPGSPAVDEPSAPAVDEPSAPVVDLTAADEAVERDRVAGLVVEPMTGEMPILGDPASVLEDFGSESATVVLAEIGERRSGMFRRRAAVAGLPRDAVPMIDAPDAVEGVRVLPGGPAVSAPVEEPAAVEPEVEEPAAVEPEVEEPAAVEPEVAAQAAVVEEPAAVVDDLFARIRESRAEAVAHAHDVLEADAPPAVPTAESASGPASEQPRSERPEDAPVIPATSPSPPEPEAVAEVVEHDPDRHPDAVLLTARDAAVATTRATVARKIKRVLADEQNELQDLVRRTAGKLDRAGAAELLETRRVRYLEVLDAEVPAVVAAGAATGSGPADATVVAAEDLSVRLETALLAPLRQRLGRALEEATGDEEELLDRVRSCYREAKVQAVEPMVTDLVHAAFNLGVAASVPAGSPLRWVVDPETGCCPDCDDDALAGAVPRGEPFPTGVMFPPGHDGCRCLVVPET